VDKQIPISAVVLSSQKVDLKDAIYNATKEKERNIQEAVNPLVENGAKLIPSVTRVFSTSRSMYVYLQAYQQGATAVQPLVSYVTFYQGGNKVFETPPMKVVSGMNNPLKTMSLNFDIALKDIPLGEYDCQVSVLDPAGQRIAFWRAPVKLVQ
jgi:hypothetical protein